MRPAKAEKILRILEEQGFVSIRQKGSHVVMKHADGRSIVIPDHQGEELGTGIIRSIIRQAGLTREEFIKYINKK
ncbi:type II toxin-antitoxin system HicA family toxin [Methanocalculus alkaliphilus]|uniref:type II toxin-antitoxin system HicA family toxin n=1 Tax=Methanocalculus alkaliphilus TaxID=768730 RepID=UPI0020A1ED65|nr:type II toxin-antitoxin system HicA family toxin [Methanocalculus alkaliphilus]